MLFRQIRRVKSESLVGSNNMEDIENETSSSDMTLEMNMKGFIDKYFFTNLSNMWSLESFVLKHDRPGYIKKNCLYLYKEELQNICKLSEFNDEVKSVAKKKCTNLLDFCSARADILQNRLSLLVSKVKSANDTIDAVFTEADVSLRERNGTFYTTWEQFDETSPEILPRHHLFSQVKSDSYVVNLQDSKHDRDSEEEEDDTEEFNVDQTITGGKNVFWIVDGIDIQKKFTEYQLETKLLKTKPKYYDKEKETSNNIENKINSLLHEVISRDINMSKKKLNQQKGLNEPLKEHLHYILIELMEDTNLLLESISEETFIVSVLGPILNKIFIKNKKSWRIKYGEICLKASTRDCNSQKEDDKHRSSGNKIDAIIALKEEDKEFLVVKIYMMIEVLRFSFPKIWKDMKEVHKVVMGLLKYEHFLSSSSEGIQDFMWYDCKNS
ncbi:hypothetical protein C1645_775670 [Glomus cerebriforme]|uniref:Uncharacterized protein n=1 Tax=Glomus cerebriforme TaxID=658196 RepID=A0A397SR12_9GLOM|nr:hypothetical protein C1645_775670 [Glomus cerebriforme]